MPNPDEFVILSDRISKEPLGPMVRRADDNWLDVVRWSMMAMLEAEENGVTSANADEMLAESPNPTVQRLLGKSGAFGKQMGLDNAVCPGTSSSRSGTTANSMSATSAWAAP